MSGVTADSVKTYRLYPAADFAIKSLGLSQNEEETIAHCVSRYSFSTASNIYDYFSWLVFRITNAFASIFGKSAWDNAVKVLQDNFLQSVSEQGGLITTNPQNNLDLKINEAVHIVIAKAGMLVLEAIYGGQCNCEDLTEKDKQENKDLSFRKMVIDKLSEDVKQVRTGELTPEGMISSFP